MVAYPAEDFPIDHADLTATARLVIEAYNKLDPDSQARLCSEAQAVLDMDDCFAVSITDKKIQLGFHADCIFAGLDPRDIVASARTISESIELYRADASGAGEP